MAAIALTSTELHGQALPAYVQNKLAERHDMRHGQSWLVIADGFLLDKAQKSDLRNQVAKRYLGENRYGCLSPVVEMRDGARVQA